MNVSKLLIQLKLTKNMSSKVNSLKNNSRKKVVKMDLRIFQAKTSNIENNRIENPKGNIHR
jgi:hypothetical protein